MECWNGGRIGYWMMEEWNVGMVEEWNDKKKIERGFG